MSEELDNTQEVKPQEELDKNEIKKRNNSKKKELEIIEQYQYIPLENEQLIMDKPSESLEMNKKDKYKNKTSELNKKDSSIKNQPKIEVKSNKELYELYIKELKNFSLNLNGEIIYDSSIDKSKCSPIIFDNDFFILYGKNYSYNGLKIQKIIKK